MRMLPARVCGDGKCTRITDDSSAADVVPGDRAALVDLFNAAGGAEWSVNTNWATPAYVCSWYGVQCSGDGSRVVELYVATKVVCLKLSVVVAEH